MERRLAAPWKDTDCHLAPLCACITELMCVTCGLTCGTSKVVCVTHAAATKRRGSMGEPPREPGADEVGSARGRAAGALRRAVPVWWLCHSPGTLTRPGTQRRAAGHENEARPDLPRWPGLVSSHPVLSDPRQTPVAF